MVATTKLLSESSEAATYTVDELKRKLREANKGFEDISNSKFVEEPELRRLAQYELSITKITKQLENQKSKNLFGVMTDEIKKLEKELKDATEAQKSFADQLRDTIDVRKEEFKLYGAPIVNPLAFLADSASGEGNEKVNESKTLATLLEQRLEILKRIDTLRKEASRNGNIGLFDIEGLTQAKEQLAEIEKLLKLAGITLDKKKKPKKSGFLNDVLAEFEALNFGTEVTRSGAAYESPIGLIESDARRASEALKVLNKLQLDNNIVTSRQALTQAGVSDAAKLTRKELTALVNYYESVLEQSRNDDTDGVLFMFGRGKDSKIDFDSTHKAVDDLKDAGKRMKDDFEQAAKELESFILVISTGLADMLGNAFRNSIEGTKSFAESLKEDLVNALQRVLTKVLALIVAFSILNLLSGGIGTVGKLATKALNGQDIFQYVGSGLMGTRSSGGEGGMRVQGVLTGSDLSISTKRGVTANERIYG